MKRKLLLLLLLSATGCTGMPSTDRGMATGGVLGGIVGTGVGALTGRPGAGMLIGAGAGAAAGGLVGAAKDERDEKRAIAAAQAQSARQLQLMDVAQMARAGNSDAVIINQIRTTGSTYQLTSEQVTWLHQSGVSDSVITEMQSRQGVPVIYRHVRPVYPEPPPIGMSVGWVYSH